VVQNAYLGITTVPSGPAPLAKLMDTLSQDLDVPPVQSALYDIKTYRRILNQVNWSPLVQKCTRNNYYFNSTSNTNLFRTGSVTLYGFSVNPLTGSVLSPISAAIADPTGTLFSGLGALRMTCGQWVGQEFTEDCATAVMNNDKSAWE
jgi:hypothetical protein